MKSRNLLVAVLLLAFAVSALAALSPEKAKWAESPVQFLMTKEEAAQWKSIQNDADADAFITLFWARRGGAQYKADEEQRWKYADEKFSVGKTKGSVSDRGKVLALFGVPTKALRSGGRGGSNTMPPSDRSSLESNDPNAENQNLETQVWVYEGDNAQKLFGTPKVEIRFVDRLNTGDFRMQAARFDFGAAQQRAIAESITQPNLKTIADLKKQQAPAAPPPPAAPAAPDLKTPAYVAAITDAKAGKGVNKAAVISVAEFVSPSGDYYAPVMLYIPKSAGVAADAADTFFLEVDDANGNRVASDEEPVKLETTHGDLYADHTVAVPAAGKYTVTAGVGKAGAPVVVATRSLDLAPVGKDASGTSKLLLSSDVVELPSAMPEKAPFAFGKLKIIPKADLAFTNKDDLTYFVELNNPGIDPATNMPKVQMGIDLMSNGKTISRLPLSEAQVGPLSGRPGPGHYALSDAIPLSKMAKPLPAGDYTLKMKIVDAVTKQSYTLEQSFKITG
jgi:GWxTD domain-containing protein